MKDYIYMGSRLLAEYQPSGSKYYYYTSDQINSTRIITDNTGSVVYSALFDPYGGMQKQWVNTYSPSLKFSGKEREANTELDYFGARYYGHKQYRFISVDPVINKAEALANPQLWNLYSYCRNNPVTYFDTDGRSSFKCNVNIEFVQLYGPDLHGYRTGVTKPSDENPINALKVNSVLNKNDSNGSYSLSIEASLNMKVAVLDPSGWNSNLDTLIYSILGWDTTNTLRHELNHVSDVENIVTKGLDKLEGINFANKSDAIRFKNGLFKNVVSLINNASNKSKFWRDSPLSPISWKENFDVMQGK
jgi:RHS repeat-associated protein